MIGKTISHYRIVEKLGEGGMGVVYRAEDTKLHRPVALKFLHPELTRDPEAKVRFMHEAEAAASLSHANICTIYEIDEYEGQLFIAMEFIEGERLKDRVDRGPLPIGEALEMAEQAAQGLARAHAQGIVHRDIKPANIIVTKEGLAKIVDFGLAKLAGTKVTRVGSTLGTAQYMSPEQARGEDVDGRSDIWSLGVVLYEMLTGLPPFRGDYEQAIVFNILNAVPEPITSLRTGVPVELERIAAKCLEKDRAERYQTAADLAADLRRLERTMGAGAGSADRPAAARSRPARGMRWPYWAVPALVVAVVAGIFLVKTPRRTAAPREKSIAVLPFVDMSPQRDQEYFCDGITDELIHRLSNIKDLRVPARTSAFFFKGKTQNIQEVGDKLKVQTVLEGSVRKAGERLRVTAQLINAADGYHIWSETYERRLEDVFEIQDEISAAIVNALQLKLAPWEARKLSERRIDNVRAYECYLKASRQIFRFDEKSIDSALVYLRTAIDIMGENAELYAGMALAYSQYANIGMGQEEYLELSEEYARKALALNPDLPSALQQLATLSSYKGFPEGRRDDFLFSKKALVINPYEIGALRSMAVNYAQIGRPAQALEYAAAFERRDPLNPWRHAVRGLCYFYDCRFGPAAERARDFYGADSTSPIAQQLYAEFLAYSGKSDEALAVIDRVDASKSRNVQIVFALLLKSALLKDRQGALRLMTPDFRKTCRRDYEWSYFVGSYLSLLGEKDEALDWLENAVGLGFINYPFMQCDPFLAGIRGDERFEKLMTRAKYEWEHFEVPE